MYPWASACACVLVCVYMYHRVIKSSSWIAQVHSNVCKYQQLYSGILCRKQNGEHLENINLFNLITQMPVNRNSSSKVPTQHKPQIPFAVC